MKLLAIGFLFCLTVNIYSQINYEGTYTGEANGDKVLLQLFKIAAKKYAGKLSDSHQLFELTLEDKQGSIFGSAVENNLGISAKANGNLQGDILKMNLHLDPPYHDKVIELILMKENKNQPVLKNNNNTEMSKNLPKLPAGATHDPLLIGSWTKNENYQSGYGSDQMHASYSEQLIFFADGSLGDGGTKASMSGDNYYGQSQGNAVALKDIYWYTMGNQLYLMTVQQGKSQAQHLGRYYIEDGKMLITANNGNKTLLIKN